MLLCRNTTIILSDEILSKLNGFYNDLNAVKISNFPKDTTFSLLSPQTFSLVKKY